MSNDDQMPPPDPAGDEPGTPGEPSDAGWAEGDGPSEQTEPDVPSEPGTEPSEPGTEPSDTGPGTGAESEPTQVIPTTPPPTGTPPPGVAAGAAGATGVTAAAGGPGGYDGPPGADVPVDEYDLPWYKQPGRLALALFAALAVIGLIVLLIILFSDDDDGGAVVDTDDPLSIVVTRLDDTGTPLVTSLSAAVSAGDPFPDAYVWVVPSDAIPGEVVTRSTDASGRAEFRWEAVIGEGTDPQDWDSTVEIGEVVSAERAAAGVIAQCDVQRSDDAPSQSLTIETAYAGDEADPAGPRVATYSFPNAQFTPGSRITCEIQDNPAVVPTSTTTTSTVPTTSTTTTTTVPPTSTTTTTTTTTVPPTTTTTTTTVPPTTTTVAPTTTAAPTTTVAPTTVAPTTAAPTTTVAPPVVTPGSALEFMNSRSDLTSFVGLISQAGIIDEFDDPARVMTVLAPDNDAVAAFAADPNAPDLANPGVLRDLVRAHVVDGQALLTNDIAALTELPVRFGDPQPVDPGPPLLVGGAEITDIDHQATASVVQIIDTVLTPLP